MLAVKGVFHQGVAQPSEPVNGRDGQPVIIAFVEADPTPQSAVVDDTAWDAFEELVERCAVHTGISDLAHQHDHYLYRTPKKE